MNPVLDAALAWHDAGFSVVPVKTDGTKAPIGSWKRAQEERASADELRAWFDSGHPGIGVVTGSISGNLEMLEAEGRAVADHLQLKLGADLEQSGHAELWQRIKNGYVEQSPSGGFHYMYRVSGPVAGNTKLAQRPTETDGKATPLFETRGEHGMVVIAPSHGSTHPSGKPWLVRAGSPATIATITPEERDLLHAVARSFDEMPPPPPIPERRTAPSSPGDLTPGEDYNIRGDWESLLTPHGWQVTYVRGDSVYWTRPGKSTRLGASAVTGGSQGDYMYVWTTSSELPSEQALSKWRVYAYLEHGGDFPAAAAQLRRDGYGTDRPLPESTKSGESFDSWPEIERPIDPGDGEGAGGDPKPESKLRSRLYTREALRSLPRPKPLIADTLDVGTVAMLVGYWGSMKSFVALSWAASIATGAAWLDRKVESPGKVLVVASEGAHGISDRLDAWESGWHSSIESDRFIVLGAAPNLGSPSDMAELCGLIVDENVRYVFVDTFAKCVTGMDENSSKDMGIAVQSLYRLQAATRGGSVVAVHHTGKDGMTTRGSSAIEAGVDTVYRAQKLSEGLLHLERTKRKDGETTDEIDLRLTPVMSTRSCILELQGGGNTGLSKQVEELMTAYRECFSQTGCSKKELLVASMIPEQHFYRVFNAALDSGALVDVGTSARPFYRGGSE